MIYKNKDSLLTSKRLLPALWHRTLEQSQFWHPARQLSSRQCRHWALQILDHWHWSLRAPRKRYWISLGRPYTPRSAHCHSSLHLQRRRKMQRHAHTWASQHSTKGSWIGKIQQLTCQHPFTPYVSCIWARGTYHTQRYCYIQTCKPKD
jgi:hypothetical protein